MDINVGGVVVSVYAIRSSLTCLAVPTEAPFPSTTHRWLRNEIVAVAHEVKAPDKTQHTYIYVNLNSDELLVNLVRRFPEFIALPLAPDGGWFRPRIVAYELDSDSRGFTIKIGEASWFSRWLDLPPELRFVARFNNRHTMWRMSGSDEPVEPRVLQAIDTHIRGTIAMRRALGVGEDELRDLQLLLSPRAPRKFSHGTV